MTLTFVDEIGTILHGAMSAIYALEGGGEIVVPGGAFGDANQDTELKADRYLGELILRELEKSSIPIGCVNVEGMQAVELGGSTCWATIDPLDGSLNFKTKGGTLGLPYSSCITLLRHKASARFQDVICAGVIDLRNGDLWLTWHDGTRFHTTLNRMPAKTAEETKLDLGRMIVFGEMYYPENREKLADAFAGKKGWLRNPGSAAYEMALISSGQAVAYICDRQKQHELGAAYALVKGAGGIVTDWEGHPLDERSYDFVSQTPVVLACNRDISDQLLELLHRSS